MAGGTGGYICQLVSGELRFNATCSEKERLEKIPFIATNNWIVLAVWWSVNYVFAQNSLIFWKSLAKERESGISKVFIF